MLNLFVPACLFLSNVHNHCCIPDLTHNVYFLAIFGEHVLRKYCYGPQRVLDFAAPKTFIHFIDLWFC